MGEEFDRVHLKVFQLTHHHRVEFKTHLWGKQKLHIVESCTVQMTTYVE